MFRRIAHERLKDFVIPAVDGGEIFVENLLLTAKGLLVVDIKAVVGSVFGGDKMQDWTVISSNGRYTFSNPQPALQERVLAVRLIARDVPVSGRVLFLEEASFTRGTPAMACTLQDLLADYEEKDADAAEAKVNAFRQQWDALREKAVATQLSQLLRGRDG
ncbi:MAG TPA: nuclease-related domain-containing protein [Woeseiaceae bacterium]